MEVNFDSVSIASGTYNANEDIIILSVPSTANAKKIAKDLICLNTDASESAVITIKLGSSIILTQTILPGEYIKLSSMITVTQDNPLIVKSTSSNVDFSILMVIGVTSLLI